MLTLIPGYELSRRAGKVGTPERPLSDLGLRGYLSFWVSHLIRFLRYGNITNFASCSLYRVFSQVLSALPPDFERVRTLGNLPDLTKNPIGEVQLKKRKRAKSGEDDNPNPVPFDGRSSYS